MVTTCPLSSFWGEGKSGGKARARTATLGSRFSSPLTLTVIASMPILPSSLHALIGSKPADPQTRDLLNCIAADIDRPSSIKAYPGPLKQP